ncbi:MAG: hypothetical protein Q8O67_02760 [Deltaproteobacteria bacterium]|nr:hypothetical protein [Deltaproteobacteria bacterium]
MNLKTTLLVLASAAAGSALTYVVAARAAGIPSGDDLTPVLVYSGVLINNGVPVTAPTEIEIALWDDPVRGEPDLLLCETAEGTTITPDATGAFSVPLPDTPGGDFDCLTAFRTNRKVYVQVKIAGTVVKFADAAGLQTVDRPAVANVPFAIEAGRASAAGLPGSQLENRIRALETQAFGGAIPDAGPEVVDAGP